MKKYNLLSTGNTVQFSYKGLPTLFFVILAQLGVTVEFTGNRMHPYMVRIAESEFMSCVSMASE